MLNPPARARTSALLHLLLVFAATLCLTLTACGAGDRSAADTTASAAQASEPKAPTQVASSQKSAQSPPLSSANGVAPTGVRSNITAFVAALTVSDTQRSTLYQAARAMQATLGAMLSSRAELQTIVNDLDQARACMRAHLATDSEAAWNALNARTYDTPLRRLSQALFVVASRLFTQSPIKVSCTTVPAATGDVPGAGVTPPSPPPTPLTPPTVGQQLRAEIERLEQQGVLPKLDRGTDVRGPDTNNNGVRDDIDAYIAALSLTDAQKKAVMQRARSQQAKLLVDPSDKQAVKNLSIQSIAATNCMGDVFEGDDPRQSVDLSNRILAITANTPERAQRYIRFLGALSGTSVRYPNGNTCEE